MVAVRPPLIHPSALSPAEHDAWTPVMKRFTDDSKSQPQLHIANPQAIWEWIKMLFGPVSDSTEFETLAVVRSPSASSSSPIEPVHQLLALLRLYSHSKSNRHLTRDHIFIQLYDPVVLKPAQLDSLSAATSPKLPEKGSASSFAFPLLAIRPLSLVEASENPVPPQRDSSLRSSATSKNPFHRHNSETTLKNDATLKQRSGCFPREDSNLSPPLPPRPALVDSETLPLKRVEDLSVSEQPVPPPSLPPPIPSRRIVSAPDVALPGRPSQPSDNSFPSTGNRLSVISSSSSASTLKLADSSVLKALPRSKIGVPSSHIGPTSRLRSDGGHPGKLSGPGGHQDWVEGNEFGIAIQKGRMTRSNSTMSSSSGPIEGSIGTLALNEAVLADAGHVRNISPPRSNFINHVDNSEGGSHTVLSRPSKHKADRRKAPAGLSRSQTLDSKPMPPPPPKRRSGVESTFADNRDPFQDQGLRSKSNVPLRPSKSLSSSVGRSGRPNESHDRAVSLSSHASEKMKEIGADFSTIIGKSGQSSEVWVHKARESLSRRGVSNREEQERLYHANGSREDLDGDTADDDAEYDAELRSRREDMEREARRASEKGWAQLQ